MNLQDKQQYRTKIIYCTFVTSTYVLTSFCTLSISSSLCLHCSQLEIESITGVLHKSVQLNLIYLSWLSFAMASSFSFRAILSCDVSAFSRSCCIELSCSTNAKRSKNKKKLIADVCTYIVHTCTCKYTLCA